MAKEEQTHGFRRFSGMIIFILIAALLWLIIKLSDTYTVNIPFAIHYFDVPASQTINDNDQKIDATVKTTGFKLLNYYFTFVSNRKIDISLNELNYQKTDSTTYSFDSKFIAEGIASFLSASPADVQLKDNIHYFSMSPLVYKKVKVVPEINISFAKQYNYYGKPIVSPDSITIYGSANDIKKINEVRTKTFTQKDVKKSLNSMVKIDLGTGLKSNTEDVSLTINVERYTEAETVIPIATPDNINMFLSDTKTKVKYIVAIKDYSHIDEFSFKAIVDTTGISQKEEESVLPVKLTLYPNNTKIISINPNKVEGIIIK